MFSWRQNFVTNDVVSQLFGTANATGARAWCIKWGWPLLWALGPNDPAADHMMGGGSTSTYAVGAARRVPQGRQAPHLQLGFGAARLCRWPSR
jgi:hypothetical protein